MTTLIGFTVGDRGGGKSRGATVFDPPLEIEDGHGWAVIETDGEYAWLHYEDGTRSDRSFAVSQRAGARAHRA